MTELIHMARLLEAVFIRTTLVKAIVLLLGFALLALPHVRSFRIYRVRLGRNQLWRELLPALGAALLDVLLIAAFRSKFLHRTLPPTPLRIAISFLWMFLMFELWFYVTHRLLHTRALYFLHAQHHVAHVTEPLTALSFSIPERVVLMGGGLGLVLLGTTFLPITMAGVVVYMLLNYVLNVYGHINLELMPKWFLHSPLGRVFFTTTFHAIHHARFASNYGLFTIVLDRLFGSACADYHQVHARARSGLGLTRLGQCLTDAPAAIRPFKERLLRPD